MTVRFGFGFLVSLVWYVMTVLAGLVIHTFVVYPIASLAAHVSPVEFFKRVRTVMLTAFSTSSSNATLPDRTACVRAESRRAARNRRLRAHGRRHGEPERHGASEGVTVLFLAQLAERGPDALAAIDDCVSCRAGQRRTAGAVRLDAVRRAVLVTIGINPALIAAIMGVDRLLDMPTVVNGGDLAATVWAKGRGHAEDLESESRIYNLKPDSRF